MDKIINNIDLARRDDPRWLVSPHQGLFKVKRDDGLVWLTGSIATAMEGIRRVDARCLRTAE